MQSQIPASTTTFREFEHRGWQDVAGRYHDFFPALTSQAIPSLLDAVLGNRPEKENVRLLDIATGPGYVAGAAAKRGAAAIGVDFSLPMARLAAGQNPSARYAVGDAEQLPFASGSFDAVVANFGLLHLGQPERALAEAHRVLRSRGRVAFTVWVKPEEAVAFGIVLRAIEAYGNPNVSLPPGPPFFRFSDAAESSRVLLAAGFASPQVQCVPQLWRLRSPGELFEAMISGTVRTRALLRAQSQGALQAIRSSIIEAARAFEVAGGIELPMPAQLASATKA